MTKLNDDNTNNSTTTQEPLTLSPELLSLRLTPEQRARSKAIHERMVNGMINAMAEENRELFGETEPQESLK